MDDGRSMRLSNKVPRSRVRVQRTAACDVISEAQLERRLMKQ